MAGVTDKPFRQLCRKLGAGMAVSEMISSDSALYATRKSQRRLDFEGESTPKSVQIVGSDPQTMAKAARINVGYGAEIIDINMGCPAKKVCKVDAGSALLRTPDRVREILNAVVSAVDIPVTLKIRTGWDEDQRNGVEIANIAQESGIQALSVHGRTRACRFMGSAEYDTIRAIKQAIDIPVIANGDIDSPEKAKQVLEYTGADALMIGRAAQGRPWIFKEILHFFETGKVLPYPTPEAIRDILIGHLETLYRFYGDHHGVRVARKHIAWYSKTQPGGALFRKQVNQTDTTQKQMAMIHQYFDQLAKIKERAA
jgi:tRNA-dihydrouridine synthase B